MGYLKNLIYMFMLIVFASAFASASELSPIEQLGKSLFFDAALSNPQGQSCADCHDPAAGWTGPDSAVNAAGAVMAGAVHTRFGNRKPPSSAYAGFNPILHKCGEQQGGGMGGNGGMNGNGGMGEGNMACQGQFAGGMFWDGRATGWTLGDPLAEQAQGPFLNPLEMNDPNAKLVCIKVRESSSAGLFEEVWGAGTLDCVRDVALTYERIARSIAAYERSSEVNPFSSKFDVFWRNREQARSEGRTIPPVHAINMMNSSRFKGLGLNDMELMGLVVFNTKGKCSTCHLLRPMHGSEYPLFTDFQYHNLGLPKNPENPYYTMPRQWNADGENWVDLGLGGFLERTGGAETDGILRDYTAFASENRGKHKTPTLRNVDMRPSPDFVKAYGHNGSLKSLMLVVHFYNCRDAAFEPQCMMLPPFPEPEVRENMNTADMGNLGLTQQEGMALIAFMKTLTDGFAR
ncbi:MAG: cytochrome-c peroxidase [Nitrospirota bacterium]